MNAAETLREAARLMRERAEGATGGRWAADAIELDRPGYVLSALTCPICGADDPLMKNDATHIAAMDPTVALAVADWLKSVAADVAKRDNPMRVSGRYETLRIPDEFAALAVARAYLREES